MNKMNPVNLSHNSNFLEDSYNIYICGVGGQGIIKTSLIIADAAINEGYNVIMSEIHGMSQRGGVVSTELKLGQYKSSIIENFKADMIIGFEPIEIVRSLIKANNDTKLIFNTHPIVPPNINSQDKEYPDLEDLIFKLKNSYNHIFPMEGNKLAQNAGSILSLNMIFLGGAVAIDSFPLSKKSIIRGMKNNLDKKFHNMNLKAIENGYNYIKNLI
jgi:indolepyruvate ferredoxin oxidoreductase beta subunit